MPITRDQALEQLLFLRAQTNRTIGAFNSEIKRIMEQSYERFLAIGEEFEQKADEAFARRATSIEGEYEVTMLRIAAQCCRDCATDLKGKFEKVELLPLI